MPISPLDRRALLRGAAGAVIALPFLDAMIPTRARAQAAAAQKRFMTWYTPNGQEPQWWFEGGSITNPTTWSGGPLIKALEAHKSELLIVQNIENRAAIDARAESGGTGHPEGMWTMMTGTKAQGGVSLDRLIAAKHFRATNGAGQAQHRRDALDTVAIPMWPDVNSSFSYNGSMIRGDMDPRVAWDRFFKDYTAPDAGEGTPDPRPGQRKSVLSLVLEDYRALRNKLGNADRQRLERHLTEVESLEKRIIDAPPATLACTVPSRPPALAANEEEFKFKASQLEDIGKWNLDLAYYAFACDLTPVANVMFGRAGGDAQYKTLGIFDNHHGLTHPTVSGIPDAPNKRRRIITWYTERMAEFATRLKETPDASGGSLFDHTLIYWTSEISEGNGHGQSNYSAVLLGKADGAFRMGRVVEAGKKPHNDLLAAIATAYGVGNGGRFGDYGTGPMSGLLV